MTTLDFKYKCPKNDCDKSYTTKFSLIRHLTSHNPVKKHVCAICFKSFALVQYLKEHMHIHTGQNPYKCNFPGCDKSFRQAGKLSLHKKLHTKAIFEITKATKTERPPAMQPLE